MKPQTVIDWQKRRFKRYWKKICEIKKKLGRPTIPKEHIEFIREISKDHPDYGEDRIFGILKENFGVEHSTATIRKYMVKHPKGGRGGSQKWSTFLRNEAKGIWACDFMVEHTITFKLLYIFVIMKLEDRQIVHFNMTQHPTLEWTKQQIREATPWDEKPKFLIHDNDGIYGQHKVEVVNEETGRTRTYRSSLDFWLKNSMDIRDIPTPYRAPNANADCERLILSIRSECLDHIIIFNERHLKVVLSEYKKWFNHARFHQGIDRIPDAYPELKEPKPEKGRLIKLPVLNGLHHDYRLAA